MRIFIASEFRCHIYQNEYYLSSKAFSIYKRYADAFGKVILCSRFIRLDNIEKGLIKTDFIEDIISINNLSLALLGKYDQKIEEKINNCNLVIGRLPSIIAYRAADIARKCNIPFLAELMCDGWDPYWNHGVKGKVIAPYMHLKMKKVTYNANFALYVTENYLQNRYSCKNPSVSASNVLLKTVNEEILQKRLMKIRKMSANKKEISVMTTASIDLLSKGQRFVVRAMEQLKKQGIIVRYHLVGGGEKKHLISEAEKSGVLEQLEFLGELTLDEVFAELDKIDIYIQPSLQEGLPRAVIEAMSRGCPCIGANTAGIPELIDRECIVKKASSIEISETIKKMLSCGLEKYAIRNFEHSKEYLESNLNARRNKYFAKVFESLKEN